MVLSLGILLAPTGKRLLICGKLAALYGSKKDVWRDTEIVARC